MTYFN